MRSDNATADRKTETPIPLGLVVKNGSKMFSVFSSVIPVPWSVTDTITDPPSFSIPVPNEQPARRSIATSHRVTSIHYQVK